MRINEADHHAENLYLPLDRIRSCSTYRILIEVGLLRLPRPGWTMDTCPNYRGSYILYTIRYHLVLLLQELFMMVRECNDYGARLLLLSFKMPKCIVLNVY